MLKKEPRSGSALAYPTLSKQIVNFLKSGVEARIHGSSVG